MKRKVLVYLTGYLLFLFQYTHAQEYKWGAGFHGFLDNREFFNNLVNPQTIFGARTFVQSGIAFNEYQEFAIGINLLYEFGGEITKENLDPILYFRFDKAPAKLYLGAFPRNGLVNMPMVLLSDTVQYYRPNVEGIFFELYKSWGYQNVWLDWTSRQTDVVRETFLLGGTGKAQKGILFYKHDFIMYHYAGPAIPIEDDHIRDNGGLTAFLGVDFSSRTLFDTLSLNTGIAFSYDQERNVYDLQYYTGSLTELNVAFRGFGVKNTFYMGDGQVQMLGDGMYASDIYNRTDVFWKIFRKGPIKGRIEFSFHMIPNVVDFSQKLSVYLDLNGSRKLKSSF